MGVPSGGGVHGGVDGDGGAPSPNSDAGGGDGADNAQSASGSGAGGGIDLGPYATPAVLAEAVGGDALKSELARLGLKCGGTVSDRAARLFLTKDTPLDELPAKVFAKKKGGGKKARVETDADGGAAAAGANGAGDSQPIPDRRVDIARLEAVVTALLD